MKMPFLGRDWRSPGDQWVRTHCGWEKLKLWRVKVFENLNENLLARLIRLAVTEFHGNQNSWYQHHQPHIHYIKGITRERKVLTSLSEAFVHLDLSGAVKDIRRFNYVAKVLEILLCGKLSQLSGTSQKYVINILDDVVNQVIKTKTNVAAVRNLLNCAMDTLTEGEYFHIGSKSLWHKHIQSVHKMVLKVDTLTLDQRANDGLAMLEDLPEDCIRCIFNRLADHKDIVHTSLTNTSLHHIGEDRLLWKQMCFFHFKDSQLITFLPKELEEDQENVDWKYIYRRCVKRFGKKDVFADTLAICCNCDTLFWKSIGHPCLTDEDPLSRTLSPAAFIQLFHL